MAILRRGILGIVLLSLFLFVFSGAATAAMASQGRSISTARVALVQVAPTAPANGDSTPLNLGTSPTQATGATDPTGGFDVVSVLIKLVIVVALLFVTLRVLKALNARRESRESAAVANGALTLHSEPVGAGQRLIVLDLGTRILLVGGTVSTLSPLTEISDPEELAVWRTRFPARVAEKSPASAVSFSGTLSSVMSGSGAQVMKSRLSESMQTLRALRNEVEKQ